MSRHWTLEDISWQEFDATKVDLDLLAVVKAAALVEYNADHYVDYLVKVFDGHPEIQCLMTQWGKEEEQHGMALAKWCLLADPAFDFEAAVEKFNQIYRANGDASESVRGSLGGEMVSRCVVESATSFFYAGIREHAREPVLKQITNNISRDEFAHYQLFLETLGKLSKRPSIWSLLKTALGRVGEVADDELASAYYASNYEQFRHRPYDETEFGAAYTSKALSLYKEDHAKRMSSMIARAVGIAPYGRLMRSMHPLIWKLWRRNIRNQKRIADAAGLA